MDGNNKLKLNDENTEALIVMRVRNKKMRGKNR